MWRIFQGLIALGILFANVHWQWTPNPYLASLFAIAIALGVTGYAKALIDRRRERAPH